MLFNSIHFLLFYVAVLIGYFSIAFRWRWAWLLSASYYFYMCSQPRYALLLAGLTGIGYLAAWGMESSRSHFVWRLWFTIGLGGCAGMLILYKYLDFFLVSVSVGLGAFDVHWQAPLLHLIIPVGISFHTFQSIGYLIDVHRGTMKAERHLGLYALFIVFFPQLLAGPIERSAHILPQFHAEHAPTYDRISSGARWALWGLFKKMAVADLLAPFVNHVYDAPRGLPGPILLLATFFFTIQIYCDFSGYSDIALGVARIMGFELMVNFRQPYLSRSISEFWSRWHISLSTWFRDYLYIPLGGNRVGRPRWAVNVLIVFLISGLWHGASVLFIFWGLLHGSYLLVERLITPPRERAIARGDARLLNSVLDVAKIAFVFVLVMVAWVLFRAKSPNDAAYVLGHIWRPHRIDLDSLFGFGLPRFEFMLALVMIAVLLIGESLLRFRPSTFETLWSSRKIRYGICVAGFYAIVFFGVFDRVEFIYFQF